MAQRFFSITAVENEISIVLEQQQLHLFTEHSNVEVDTSEIVWRAIEVTDGASGTGTNITIF